jgi:hypothetical protein
MKSMIAIAQVVGMFSNIRTPRWASAAAAMEEGMRKTAIADPAMLVKAGI